MTAEFLRAQPRYWEQVQPGDVVEGFSMQLTWTTMASQVSGSQDWNLVHHDPDFAVESGHSGTFYNTGWTSAMLGRAISDWAGAEGRLRSLDLQMRKMNMQGDIVHVRGRVLDKHVGSNGECLVTLEVWLENDRVGVTTPATAVVELSGRAQSELEL